VEHVRGGAAVRAFRVTRIAEEPIADHAIIIEAIAPKDMIGAPLDTQDLDQRIDVRFAAGAVGTA